MTAPSPTSPMSPATSGATVQELRFPFGRNWSRFLQLLDDDRIAAAERSLRERLGVQRLDGRSFLDIGSGSGLFSLAARRLGAAPVVSFDYDPDSVACTRELRRRYFTADPEWTVERGDALNGEYLRGLGAFDVVYSWGVLHHTGALWSAMDNAVQAVAPGGQLFVAIYNDQGRRSHAWRAVKRLYNRMPSPANMALPLAIGGYWQVRSIVGRAVTLRNPLPGRRVVGVRGMSTWYDLVDWIGGYPFEVAKPEEVFRFCRERGLELEQLLTCGGGLGCNEFVFRRR